MSDPATPIVVNPNPVPAQVWIAVRDVLKIGGGLLVARGVVSDAELETILGALLIIGPVVWSQIRARRDREKLTVVAEAAPNSVAVVKAPTS